MASDSADLPDDAFTLSVVMPVHAGADVSQLERALTSVFDQTRPAHEVVVVEDGPLTRDQDRLLETFEQAHPSLRRVRLERQSGVAAALQAGLEFARSPWIARMDSDDVALPHRFAAQGDVIRTGRYDVLGAAMIEFDSDELATTGIRRMPKFHDDIIRLMRANNPLNHPTVVFRRSLVLQVGGYRTLPHLEDYDLWARVWAAGGTFHNLPEPLVRFRADARMLARRRQSGIHRAEFELQRNLRRYGLVSRPRLVVNLVMRTSFRLLPSPLMARAYRHLFHRPRSVEGGTVL
jgi:glycosyltransferase involved in cell wall biosynthesis